MGRYKVQFKSFKSGEWYTKTSTDNIGSAYTVAAYNSYGRAYQIVDSVTSKVLQEKKEDKSMAKHHGYPNGYPWR